MSGAVRPRQVLETVAARLVVELQVSEDLPGIATELLVAGVDSPALRIAAGVLPSEPRNARDAFLAALNELGVTLPDRQSAFLQLARAKAREICDGKCSPYEGSRWIWRHTVWQLEPCPDSVSFFLGLASTWEDYPNLRPEVEADMREAARSLAGETD